MHQKPFPVIDMVETGKNIMRLREERGMTVRDLQAYFGFEEPQAIYKWQRGKSLPTVDNLYTLGLGLGLLCRGVALGLVGALLLIAGLRLALGLGSRGARGSGLGGLGLLLGREHLLQGIDWMLLGHVVEYRVQLLIGEHLGIGLGLFIIPGDDVRNLLGGRAKIRRDFLQTILYKTHRFNAPP